MDDDSESISQSTITSHGTIDPCVVEAAHLEEEIVPAPAATPKIDPKDDPLNIKELTVNFDYLIYKINDRIKTLSEKAQASTTRLKENAELTILEIDKLIQHYYEISKVLDGINNDFNKIKQINIIISEFVPRIRALEEYFEK